MKLVLVERQDARIRCIPDLGIAHLLGQCKQEGIDARLVQGSPETLECLLDDSVFWLFEQGYKDIVRDRGEAFLKEFLKFSHHMATSRNIWDKTNPEAMDDLWHVVTYMREMVWPTWLPDQLFGQIRDAKPDVVGFSLWNFYDHPGINNILVKVIQRVRRELGIKILIGGPGANSITSRRDIMRIFSPDCIIHHEAEQTLPDFLRMTESGRYKEIPNITTKNYDGPAKPIENLDSLAFPDFSQYDLDSFFLPVRVLPMMSSRGCPWAQCAFCSHHATYSGYREHSPERVAELVNHYKKKYRTEMIMFNDETFTAQHAGSIVEHLTEAYYYSYAYPRGFDYGLLKKMHEKGFRVLVWGVESGCQRTLDSMRKGTTIAELEKILKDSKRAGITNVAFMMFGFPGETYEEAMETVEFLRKNASVIERHAATPFRLEEGSPIWDNPGRWGVKNLGAGNYSVKRGMQRNEVVDFLRGLDAELRASTGTGQTPKTGDRGLKTSSDTKYYMPGDAEFRAYLFMQAVYGEGSGSYPVRNGILRGNKVLPSLLMRNVSRPGIELNKREKETYQKCDGTHKIGADEFKKYPYVVFYERPFN